MPTFLFLGASVINLDNIAHVDLHEKANGEAYCDLWFCGGGTRKLDGADAAKLIEFMKKHKAE